MAQIIPVPINPTAFRVSLITQAGLTSVSTSTNCGTLTITDPTNYASNAESGHAPANFASFRRIIIEHYKGDIINMSSLGDGDVVITAPSSGVHVFTQAITSGDGRYQITLRACPDWSNVASYQLSDDCVYNTADGKFYRAILNSINFQPDLNPTHWEEIAEEDLPVKYNTTLFVYVDCALLDCLKDAAECAFCNIKDAFCDDDMICKNKCFLKASKLMLLYYVAQLAVQAQDATQADDIADAVTKICDCDCGC